MGLRRMDVAGGTRGAPLASRAVAFPVRLGRITCITAMSSPQNQPEEIFHRLLDESAARLAVPKSAGIAIPDDDLHREIIVPLLPAMLGDKSIRQHWGEQAATGFPARLAKHLDSGDPAPRWLPGDFEIHVTASYSAGADARALADTLLSEDSLRDMTAALMNQLLDVLWPSLAPTAITAPVASHPVVEIPEPVTQTETQPVPLPEAEPRIVSVAIPSSAAEPERAEKTQPAGIPIAHQPPSRTLIRALCGKLSASAVQRGFAAHGACSFSAKILARRIFQHAKKLRPTSPPRLPRRASL